MFVGSSYRQRNTITIPNKIHTYFSVTKFMGENSNTSLIRVHRSV